MNDLTIEQLRSKGFRLTPQRLAILEILRSSNRHLTPAEVYQRACQVIPGLTEATVYRTLNFLTGQGLALAAHVGAGQLVYEIAGRNHHHLVCRSCGGMYEIDHTDLESLYKQLQAESGYLIDTMHVTFFGLCPACQEA